MGGSIDLYILNASSRTISLSEDVIIVPSGIAPPGDGVTSLNNFESIRSTPDVESNITTCAACGRVS